MGDSASDLKEAEKVSSPFVSIDLCQPEAAPSAPPAAAPRPFFSFFRSERNDSGDSASELAEKKAGASKVGVGADDATKTPSRTDGAPYPSPRLSMDPSTLDDHALPSTVRDDDDDDRPGKPKKKRFGKALRRHVFHPKTRRQKAACGVFWTLAAAALVCFVVFALPRIATKLLIPLLERIRRTMSKPAICAMSFFAIALFPLAFLPYRLFIYLLVYVVGTGPSLGIVFAATAVAMALPFLLAKTLLRERVERWSQKSVFTATLAETVREAGPFKSVFLLRLSPVPYNLLNYACALSPDVRFPKYIAASVLGNAPEVVLHCYVGKALESVFSILSSSHKPSPGSVVSVVVPLVAAIVVAVGGVIYGKRALKKVRAARAQHAAQESAEEALERGEGGVAAASPASSTRPAPDVEMAASK